MTVPWHLIPPLCLASGLVVGLAGLNPADRQTRRLGRLFLQTSVVLLGLTIPLDTLLRTGASGLWTTASSLAIVALSGFFLARRFQTPQRLAILVTVGTGICGGSAIAAAAPVIKASDHEVAAALAIVFVLNAIALVLFPWLGHAIGLDHKAFAVWAATAIHDTSSVVGAALSYGEASLGEATTIKMTRTLWIVPTALALASYVRHREGQARPMPKSPGDPKSTRLLEHVPWFLVAFLVATAIRSIAGPGLWVELASHAAKAGLGISLLFIGASITSNSLRQASMKACALGVTLWLIAVVWGLVLACASGT